MSWGNTSLTPIRKDQIADIKFIPQVEPEGCDEAFADQLAAALEVAEMLAKSVGDDDSLVVVSIGGHANPGHASNFEGWSDETVHVSVSVAR